MRIVFSSVCVNFTVVLSFGIVQSHQNKDNGSTYCQLNVGETYQINTSKCECSTDTASGTSFENDVGLFFIQSNADCIQLDFQKPALLVRFGCVQHDQYQICRFRSWNTSSNCFGCHEINVNVLETTWRPRPRPVYVSLAHALILAEIKPTLAGSLHYTRQVQELYPGTLVLDNTRDSLENLTDETEATVGFLAYRQGSEFIGCCLRGSMRSFT